MKILTYIIAFCLVVFIEVLIGTWLWGLPALTPLQFLGLMCLVHMIMPNYNIKKEDD